jgi:cyclophilin family peptidyl-prolyl cis-trans isomerase
MQVLIALARKNYFRGVQLHRVVPDFVVQDGDPRGDGEGGPGYTIRDELNQRPYVRGTVGMALDWADTGGSQFFITHAPQPQLDTRYTVFGRVLSGMDVVDAIQQWDVIRRVTIWDGTISSADCRCAKSADPSCASARACEANLGPGTHARARLCSSSRSRASATSCS